MRLVSFRVRYFKSIIDTGVIKLNTNVLVLAGQNEAGKSAILEGLEYLSSGAPADYERLYMRQDGNTEVECIYELSDSDVEYLEGKTEGRDELHKYLKDTRNVSLTRKYMPEDSAKSHQLLVSQDCLNGYGPFFVKEPDVAGGERTWPGLGEFTDHLKSDALRTQIFYDDSFKNLLPGQVKASEIPSHPAVQDFQKVFDIDFGKEVTKDSRAVMALEQRLNRNATDDLNKYWTQKLDVGTQYGFHVKINRNDVQPLESVIEFAVQSSEDDPTPLYLEQRSKGFRWFSAFNLRLRALGVNDSHPEDVLLLIDEPGEGLHERAQIDLKQVIEELAAKGATIIYSTHNPLLIGTQGDELARIRIVANGSKDGTKVYTLSQYASHPTVGAQDALSPLVTAMGLHGIDSLRETGKMMVVVEGITDHYYYKAFATLLGYNDAYFAPAVGASNVPNVVSILLGWGKPYKVILDDDSAGRRTYALMKKRFYLDDEAEAAKVMHKPKGAAGVEDIMSGPDFRKFVTGDESKKAAAKSNSEAANGSKEVLARLFYEKIANGKIKSDDLDADTVANITKVIDWMKQ